MVLKDTTIRSSFFPHAQEGRFETSDAPATEKLSPSDLPPSHGMQDVEKQVGENPDTIKIVTWDGDDVSATSSSESTFWDQNLTSFLLQDPENPMNWSILKKWIVTGLLCLMCLMIGLATASFSSGLAPMVEELGVSSEVGQLGLFLFNGAFAIVPLVLGPLSETVGSSPVYLISFASFVIWFIPIALAQNIQTVLVSRFLLGCSGAAGVTIIPGSLAGVWRSEERAIPVALFSLVAVLGTVGAPLYCGFIVQSLGWRWVQWIHMIGSGIVLAGELIFLRETRGSVVLTRRAKKLREETGLLTYRSPAEMETPSLKALLSVSTTRAGMLLIKEPVVLFFSLWLAYAWSIVFALFSGIPIAFQERRGWSEGVGGLANIGPVLACFIGFGFSFHAKHLYDQAQAKNNGIAVPEARLYYAAAGGLLTASGMFIFSFTADYPWVHWIAPEIGLVLLVTGIYFIFDGVQSYLTDSYGEYAASAISAQGFVRNALAASFPLFSTQLFHNLSIPFGGLLLACLLTVAIPLPFILILKGQTIRARSKYAAANTGLAGGDDGPVLGSRRASLATAGPTRRNSLSDGHLPSGPTTAVHTRAPSTTSSHRNKA